jgi:hypothetical protein
MATITHPATTESPGIGSSSHVLAVTDDYRSAEQVVRKLADAHFPVEHVRIVGEDLRAVEQVTGRLTLWSAIGRSALTGAIAGLLFGWIFGLFAWITPLVAGILLALYGLITGAIIGAVWGAIFYAIDGSRRQFSSLSTLSPSRFEVLVDVAWANRAHEVLASESDGSTGPRTDHPLES